MTAFAVLAFVGLALAAALLLRMRAERRARLAAERRLAESAAGAATTAGEWHAVLAHELRSPVAAILGYEELLEDGTFGELPAAATDAVRRIRLAALHLVSLIEGVERSARPIQDEHPSTISAAELVETAVAAVALDAEGRGVTLRVTAAPRTELLTRRAAAERALTLALGAAVKASPGAELHILARAGDTPGVSVLGTRLDPVLDSAAPGVPLTGPGFRLQLARDTARAARGEIALDPDGSLHLALPRL